jgi:hypothetical protein
MVTSVYIEPRPKARQPHVAIDHYVVETEGDEVLHTAGKQDDAIDWARKHGYVPHVARVRHLINKRNPDHFRKG